MKKSTRNREDLWNNIKHANIHNIGVPEGEYREKGIKNIFEEIVAENFPNLKKERDIQVLEVHRVPNKMNPNRPTPRHVIKMAKVKDKGSKRKTKSYIQGNPVRLSADFSVETLKARRE